MKSVSPWIVYSIVFGFQLTKIQFHPELKKSVCKNYMIIQEVLSTCVIMA